MVALALLATIVIAASLASFAESYRGLQAWASAHGLHGFWEQIWPLQVDAFIAVGELALFAAMVYSWPRRRKATMWGVAIAGLAVSVAGNVGHAATRDLATRFTYAVPPLAAFAALGIGLMIVKSIVEGHHETATPLAFTVAREAALLKAGERGYAAALTASDKATQRATQAAKRATARKPPVKARRASGRNAAEAAVGAALSAGLEPPSARELAATYKPLSRTTAGKILAAASSNGAGADHSRPSSGYTPAGG